MPYPVAACRNRNFGAPPFSPLDISGLALWLKADAGTYQDSAKTTPAVADAAPVGAWADQSGNGEDALQTTDGDRPVLKLGIVNGKPVLRWVAAWYHLLNTTFSLGTTCSIFAVASHGGPGAYSRLINNNNRFYMGTDGSTPAQYASFYGDGAAYGVATGHGADANLTADTFYVLTSIQDGANDNPFLNGASVGARANTMAAFADGYVIGTLLPGLSQSWNKDIAEILIYDSALSPANRQTVEGYLSTRYGIALS